VYISYLDSVHYFRPKEKRTALYFEILIGYLDYVKQLGFAYAHIWACPPSEGDDYIFHCHPPEQRVPKPKRLQEWYKTMLDIAVQQRVVVDYKDILKDCNDSGINKASDLPYFEGDFWSGTIEDLLKELDIEEEDRRKFEELEAVKASDDGCFDDSIEPDEPTEVIFDFYVYIYLFFISLNFRYLINVNQVVVQHIRRKTSRKQLVNVVSHEKICRMEQI
jgi:E1A/CREB-binding protein